jgi:hypothetical protein
MENIIGLSQAIALANVKCWTDKSLAQSIALRIEKGWHDYK